MPDGNFFGTTVIIQTEILHSYEQGRNIKAGEGGLPDSSAFDSHGGILCGVDFQVL